MAHKDLEKRRAYARDYYYTVHCQKKTAEWKIKNKAYLKAYHKRYYHAYKAKVLEKLGGPICVYCGCDDIRILEINHVNGGGAIQRRNKLTKSGSGLLKDISIGVTSVDGLNVACRVCNAIHDVRKRFGIHNHSVEWRKECLLTH